MHRVRLVMLSALASVLVVTLAACSSSIPQGSLKVTVTGLPSGVAADVVVAGAGGYSRTVTASNTLRVPAGTYSVTAAPASTSDAIVPTVYDGSASSTSVAVTANTTSSTTVAYAVRPGSGQLWIPLHGGSLEAESLSSANLASGTAGPGTTLNSSTDTAASAAFDGVGNLWVGDYGAGKLYRYDAASLGTAGATPNVTIDTSTNGTEIYGLAFDSAGDLWVSLYDTYRLLMYTPSQLAAGGAPSPQVVIQDDGKGDLYGPAGIAFDASGALWVAGYDSSTVLEYVPSQLAKSGTPTPTVILTATAGSIGSPNTVAFDGSGNLWVSNDTGTVVRFDASQITKSGNPQPAATIANSSLGSEYPAGLAFDASGSLWVADFDHTSATTLQEFTNPGALTGPATPSAHVTIALAASTYYPLIAFDPPPSNLPIQAP